MQIKQTVLMLLFLIELKLSIYVFIRCCSETFFIHIIGDFILKYIKNLLRKHFSSQFWKFIKFHIYIFLFLVFNNLNISITALGCGKYGIYL